MESQKIGKLTFNFFGPDQSLKNKEKDTNQDDKDKEWIIKGVIDNHLSSKEAAELLLTISNSLRTELKDTEAAIKLQLEEAEIYSAASFIEDLESEQKKIQEYYENYKAELNEPCEPFWDDDDLEFQDSDDEENQEDENQDDETQDSKDETQDNQQEDHHKDDKKE